MAITTLTLDGVTLNPNMRWLEQYRPQNTAMSTTRTLGGTLVTFSQALVSGQQITLQADDDQGWKDMDLATVQAVQAKAEQTGWSGALSIGSASYVVMFRHNEPPAFDAEPLIQRLAPDASDLFIMTIKLVVIG